MARSKTRLLKVSDDFEYVHVQIEQDNGDIIRIHKRYTLDSTRSVTFETSGQTFQLYEVHRDVVETPVVDGVAEALENMSRPPPSGN